MPLNDLDGHMSDSHSMKILQNIVYGRNISIITNKDKKILIKRKIIQEINSQLKIGIIAEAKRFSKFMYPEDYALFMVMAYENDLMDYANSVLETVEYDGRLMSLSDLTGALEQESEMPAEWAVGLFGDIGEERFEKPVRGAKMPTTLDVSRLKIDI